MTNLRQDPWERYQDQSTPYGQWWDEKIWTLVPAVSIVQQFLGTFVAYPPSQKGGALSVTQFLDAVSAGAASGGK